MFSPYDNGWYAYHRGYNLYDNPYEYNSAYYVMWRQGYYDAEEEYYS